MPSVSSAADDVFAVPESVVIRDSVLDAKANGLVPDTGKDCTALLGTLLEKAKSQPGTTVKLAPGRYDFHRSHALSGDFMQSNTTVVEPRRTAILLDRHQGTVLDGNGATLVLHGELTGIPLDRCRSVELSNLHVTMARLLTTQFSDGVIAIRPEIRKDVPGKFFHRNIRIEHNTFLTFGGPLLYAHNVENLVFSGNTIVPTKAFPAWHRLKCAIRLEHTRRVTISGNKATGPLPATAIQTVGENDDPSVAAGQPFSLKP